jgi:hypothetical protein
VHQKLRARGESRSTAGAVRDAAQAAFFHEFSHAEIWEVLRASTWQDYVAGEEIVKEGEIDDRFYIIVSGDCTVERSGREGDRPARRRRLLRRDQLRARRAPQATIRAAGDASR